MSRLFGPPSETISSVSDRDCALAADQIAGAGTIAPAAAPVTDFRKSRRFIGDAQNAFGTGIARFVPILKKGLRASYLVDLAWDCSTPAIPRGVRHPDGLHTKTHICSLNM